MFKDNDRVKYIGGRHKKKEHRVKINLKLK